MKLTQDQKNKESYSLHVALNDKNEGFVLGGPAKTIPQNFKKEYENNKMRVEPVCEQKRVIDRTKIWELKSMKPAFARLTDAGTLIIE